MNPHHRINETRSPKPSDYFKAEEVDIGLTPIRKTHHSSDPGLEKSIATLREEAKEKKGSKKQNQTEVDFQTDPTEQFYTAQVYTKNVSTEESTQELLNRPSLPSATAVIEKTDRNTVSMGKF